MSQLNISVDEVAASQEEIRNTFLAQPEGNPRGQYPGTSLGGPKHEHVKVVTIFLDSIRC